MAESLLIKMDNVNTSDSHSDHSIGSALFQRRIQFHPARNTFKGFNNGGSDFKLETLNPGSSSGHQRVGSGSGTSAPGGNKNEGSELSEFGLDPEFCFGMTSRKIVSWTLEFECFLFTLAACDYFSFKKNLCPWGLRRDSGKVENGLSRSWDAYYLRFSELTTYS